MHYGVGLVPLAKNHILLPASPPVGPVDETLLAGLVFLWEEHRQVHPEGYSSQLQR
jgi:hypothetical protein